MHKGREHWSAARQFLEQALADRRGGLGNLHPDIATALVNLAAVLQVPGEGDEAEMRYKEALSIDKATYGEHHPFVAEDLTNLGLLLRAAHDYAGARHHFECAQSILREQSILRDKTRDVGDHVIAQGKLNKDTY